MLVQTTMRWMLESPTARVIEEELETLDGDLLGGDALPTYQRYNVSLASDDLLQQSGSRVRDTAHRLGFSSDVSFIRFVRGEFGKTPGALRDELSPGSKRKRSGSSGTSAPTSK